MNDDFFLSSLVLLSIMRLLLLYSQSHDTSNFLLYFYRFVYHFRCRYVNSKYCQIWLHFYKCAGAWGPLEKRSTVHGQLLFEKLCPNLTYSASLRCFVFHLYFYLTLYLTLNIVFTLVTLERLAWYFIEIHHICIRNSCVS